MPPRRNGPLSLVFPLALSWCCAEVAGQFAGIWTKQAVIFKDPMYDANMPPPEMGNPKPMNISLGITINSMSYDIMTAKLSLEYWFRLAWLDTRLYYDGTDMFGSDFNPQVSYVPVKLTHGDNPNLWVPDVYCMNASDAAVQDYGNTGVQAHLYAKEHITKETPHNVMLSRPSMMSAHCTPALGRFPFDTQTCALHFSSWVLSSKYLMMHLMGANGFQQTVDLPDSNEYQWVKGGSGDLYVKNSVYEAAGGGSGWSEIVMKVHLRRLPMYYMLNAILPMFMMVILSSFAFWIPINPSWAGSGERMGFSITCLLTIVAMGLFTADKRPMVGETTWLDRWIASCLLFTSLPVAETTAVFFLDAVFGQMMEAEERDAIASTGRIGYNTKYRKYAQLVEEARDLEARRSKKVMKVVLLAKINFPCGFFNPRGIDKWCRHIFPVVSLGRLFYLLSEISDWRGLGTHDASAVQLLFWPFAFFAVALVVGGISWLVYEYWSRFLRTVSPGPIDASSESGGDSDSEP